MVVVGVLGRAGCAAALGHGAVVRAFSGVEAVKGVGRSAR